MASSKWRIASAALSSLNRRMAWSYAALASAETGAPTETAAAEERAAAEGAAAEGARDGGGFSLGVVAGGVSVCFGRVRGAVNTCSCLAGVDFSLDVFVPAGGDALGPDSVARGGVGAA